MITIDKESNQEKKQSYAPKMKRRRGRAITLLGEKQNKGQYCYWNVEKREIYSTKITSFATEIAFITY